MIEHKEQKPDLGKAICLVAGIRSGDIPQWFFLHCRKFVENTNEVTENELSHLSDPINTFYWQAWLDVKRQAEIKALNGKLYTLYQPEETTLYLIPKKEEKKDD